MFYKLSNLSFVLFYRKIQLPTSSLSLQRLYQNWLLKSLLNMSYVDLATLAMHRRQELESRLNVFLEKCDRAVLDIKKLKQRAQGFIEQMNCEPSQLKDSFLHCVTQLEEFSYIITDFNIALNNLDHQPSNVDYMPVQDISTIPLKPLPAMTSMNLIDALSEPTPSTSNACFNQCPPEKPVKRKIPREDQLLIEFSSTSCSSESVPTAKSEKHVDIENTIKNDFKKLSIDESQQTTEECNLPAQVILQVDCTYPAIIMHVDGLSLWVITDEFEDAHNLMMEMADHYRNNAIELSLDDMMSLTYCAVYDEDDCYYRGLFIRLAEEDMSLAEVFLVDTGETRCISTTAIQSLHPKFCTVPPFARCCHLASIDLLGHQSKELLEKQESFIKDIIGTPCQIKIDDNTSESLGIYVILSSGETLNELLVQNGLALRIDKTPADEATSRKGLPELDETNLDITDCPEHEDPLEAVTGYHNRDEVDICKHYKGGSDKTCFKGRRCNKRHITKHPDGWTLDRLPVVVKCATLPLPAPGTWHRVYVTHVAHFDHFFVHFLDDNGIKQEPVPDFGVVLPPTTLKGLVLDMNSPASRMAYKPLKTIPAPGELVAALYPPDEQWYRARVISSTRTDQNVEVMYIDYGNVSWLKEDAIRQLPARHWALRAQAVRCALAGVAARGNDSRQWVAAREALAKMIHERALQAHVIARDFDEVTVELYDEHSFSIADHLAAGQYVKLNPYSVVNDTNVNQKIILP